MNISGIIVEYNPFHNGHVHHIQKCTEVTGCDGIIAVMSGNFAQRGIPSIIDKWLKTKIALDNGIDLVLELPTIYSLSSAEFFSFGAISLLNSLGIVNNLCFGSENGNVDILIDIADILLKEPLPYKNILKYYLDSGLNYPSSRNKALKDYILSNHHTNKEDIDNILSLSNNILGIEYCKSILKLNSSIKPFTIQRKGSLYNDLNLKDEFSSASAIRNHIKNKNGLRKLDNFIPKNVYDLLLRLQNIDYDFTFEESMFPYIKYKLLTNNSELNNLPDVIEGLENKIIKGAYSSNSFSELISNSKSKRYTYTRISRILTQFFVGFDRYDSKYLRTLPCPYGRVLGFNSKGQKMLKLLKSSSSIPIYTKIPKSENEILNLDIMSTKAYSMINKSVDPNKDYLSSPLVYI